MLIQFLLGMLDSYNYRKQRVLRFFDILGLSIIGIIMGLVSLYSYTYLSSLFNPLIALGILTISLAGVASLLLLIRKKLQDQSLIGVILKNIQPLRKYLNAEILNKLPQRNKTYLFIMAGVGLLGVYWILFRKK